MAVFMDLLNESELVEIPLGNQNFTLSNMQQYPSSAKLDQFLISTEWDHTFPLSKAVSVLRIISDHAPILLSTLDKTPHHMFKFEEVWLTQNDFCSLVIVWWKKTSYKGSSALTFAAKLDIIEKASKIGVPQISIISRGRRRI